jgi:two-component system CheB/CheR fusion protein
MAVFHYALKATGYLVLGNAETTGSGGELFTPLDRKLRIYQKKVGAATEMQFEVHHADAPGRSVARKEPPLNPRISTVENEAARLIQERYAPPGVIVNAAGMVMQFRGQTGMFLEPPPGDPSLNVLKMAREGLLHGIREGLQQARKSKTSVRKRGVRVRANGGWREVNLEVIPLAGSERVHFLVLFDDVTKGSKYRERRRDDHRLMEKVPGERPNQRVMRLQQELATSREYLQSIIQDVEAANEELQSANEEVLSANEELQSTNEELDTAKEELQSTNEELNTVNEELHGRNEELTVVNSDLVNLLSSVQIAIVIVARDLRIRRFTPIAERVLNLIPADVGRPISHIKPNIDCPDLEPLIAHVIDSVMPCERQVHDRQGNAFTLRIRPYKSIDNRIDGAVLALFESGDAALRAELAHAAATAVLTALPERVILVDAELRVRGVSRGLSDALGIAAADVLARPLFTVNDGQWDSAALRRLLDEQLAGPDGGDGAMVDHELPRLGRVRLHARTSRFGVEGPYDRFVVIAVERWEGGHSAR